jgi:hypothetical protein
LRFVHHLRWCPPYIVTVGRETVFARRSLPPHAKRRAAICWARAGTTGIAREPVIAGGRPQRDVKPPLTILTVSMLKKQVRTAGIPDANGCPENANIRERII